jgi:hypothetical protein
MFEIVPSPGNALQQSSDNLNLESTMGPLPFRQTFFKALTLFIKNVISMVLILTLSNESFGPC